ncbi:NUDIX hydrolase, partial [Bacteroidota bacterium]
RVVTTAYYSLIRIDKSNTENEVSNNAAWHAINNLPDLVFDHDAIIEKGLTSLRNEVRFEPICFELLPKKFTIRQIQLLYEAILGQELDNRNFRKKLLKAPYIEKLEEKQHGVAHKPASFYRFDKEKYQENKTEQIQYYF